MEAALAQVTRETPNLQRVKQINVCRRLTRFRKEMCTDLHDGQIHRALQDGTFELMVHAMKQDNCTTSQHEAQHEALWCLTNMTVIADDEQMRYIVECGVVPILCKHLESPNADVREQAVWAIGNIAGHSSTYRDLLLKVGVLNSTIFQRLHTDVCTQSMLGNATWAMSNLCRGEPAPPLEQMLPVLYPITRLVTSAQGADVLANACWALYYITRGAGYFLISEQNANIDAVIHTGVCNRLVELLENVNHDYWMVAHPVLKTIGIICAGNHQQKRTILDHKAVATVLRVLLSCLCNEKVDIRTEAARTVSNIVGCGTQRYIHAVKEAHIMPRILCILNGDPEDHIRTIAAHAIVRSIVHGTTQQRKYMREQCQPLWNELASSNVEEPLRALEMIIEVTSCEHCHAHAHEAVRTCIRDAGGQHYLERLHNAEPPHDAMILMRAERLQSYLLGNPVYLTGFDISDGADSISDGDADEADTSDTGCTSDGHPLHHACEQGNASHVKILLDAGTSVDTADDDGRTALHIASRRGHAPCVALLLGAGASVHDTDLHGMTAIHIASKHGHTSCLALLLACM